MFAYIVFLFCWIYTVNCAHSVRCPLGILKKGMTNEYRHLILKNHNDLRENITAGTFAGQPKGTNLKRMKYSMVLEKKAQEIADTCIFEHEKVTGTEWKFVGQNLAILMSSADKSVDWNFPFREWLDEHKDYKYGNGFSPITGHYTQMVWADTDNVGCAYSVYKKNGLYNQLYVCNYGPGGNIIGQNPYRIK